MFDNSCEKRTTSWVLPLTQAGLLLVLPFPGNPIYAWCGPQPNSRLLLNYGIVDESNPYDKLQLTVTLPADDPLYKVKRGILQVSCWA